MATLTRGQTFGSTETVTNTKLHNLVDLGSISNIVNADIDSSAAIVDTKLAQITTTNKVSGTAIGNLASIPSGAGLLPTANIPFISFPSLASIPNYALSPLTLTSWVDGSAMRNIQSMPSLAGQLSWYSIVSSMASGAFPFNDGTGTLKATALRVPQVFTSSGTFTAPAGVTRVFITACGAGGGGGGHTGTTGAGGGGAGGAYVTNYPYTVVPGNNYTITINAGGAGGVGAANGAAGGTTVFDTLTLPGGLGGALGPNGAGGAGITGPIGKSNAGNAGVSAVSGGFGGSTNIGNGGAAQTSDANGNNASANSGGGGSGGNSTGGSSRNGGAGGTGIVIVNY